MNNELPFLLLSRLFRGLNHELRTPLSIISNELFVLKASGSDVQIALDAVQKIDLMLREGQTLLNHQETLSSCSLQSLLTHITNISLEVESGGEWLVDEPLIRQALSEFFRIANETDILVRATVIVCNQELFIPAHVPTGSFPPNVNLPSNWLSPSGATDVMLLPILDAIWIKHGISLRSEGSEFLVMSQQQRNS